MSQASKITLTITTGIVAGIIYYVHDAQSGTREVCCLVETG
jgi:hypothetical protein